MKKLIPALCMLLIAAAMLGTSTYAWFSMNTTVTATGMQVVAKSDNTYLLISQTNSTATAIQTENAITTALTIADNDAKVYPSAPVTTDGEEAYTGVTGEKVTNEATANAVANWYTANAAAANASTIKADTAKSLTSFTGYVIKKTVYLTVAAGANNAKNLTVTPTFAQKGTGSDLTAARALITTSDGGFAILSSTNNGVKVDIKGTNTELSDTTVLTVNIYIYYDGNDTNVYTNNAEDLTGATLSLAFDVDSVPAT